jgi:ABC-type transporter Mla subunit MlaD
VSAPSKPQPNPEQELQKALAELKKTSEEVSKMLDDSIKRLQQAVEQIAPKPKQQLSATR